MSEPSKVGSTAPGRYGLGGIGGVGANGGNGGIGGIGGSALLTLQETGITAAWNLQGDAASPAFAGQVRLSFGISRLPAANTMHSTDSLSVFWLGPRSWQIGRAHV